MKAEILAKFDTRSLAGRHIVYDHLLPPRWRFTDSWWVARRSFRVDEHGFLRFAPPLRPFVRRPTYRPEVIAWIGARRIGVRGTRAYWMERTDALEKYGEERLRQTRELDPDELRRLHTLNAAERRTLVLELDSPFSA